MTIHLSRNHSLAAEYADHAKHMIYFGREGQPLEVRLFLLITKVIELYVLCMPVILCLSCHIQSFLIFCFSSGIQRCFCLSDYQWFGGGTAVLCKGGVHRLPWTQRPGQLCPVWINPCVRWEYVCSCCLGLLIVKDTTTRCIPWYSVIWYNFI